MASVYKSISKKAKKPQETNVLDEINMVDDDISSDDTSMDEIEDDEEEEIGSSNEHSAEEATNGVVLINSPKPKKSGNTNAATVSSKSHTRSQSDFLPKTRILMLTSRGVTHRHRHLLADLTALLPHSHKENKLDTKKNGGYNLLLNSLADLHSCNIVFFLEARKHGQDLYLWLSRPPNGPTVKFSITNLHTMGEMGTGFAGNCLKGGRGIVVFDSSFDNNGPVMGGGAQGNEYRGLLREMLRGVFCVPKRGVKGMKPFIDRIIGVFGVDGKIWIRVYEIRESDKTNKKSTESEKEAKVARSKDGLPDVSLIEIGPRFVLTPIVILEGSFGGPVIYENKEYVSPNQVRREIREAKAGKYARRRDVQTDRIAKKSELGLKDANKKRDALDTREVFA